MSGKACPSGKVRYKDRLGANLALMRIRAKDNTKRDRSEDHAYECSQCLGWHLTSQRVRRP